MNLTDMRARVRQDLKDTDSANYRWSDDEIDGAIQRVVAEFSHYLPQEQQNDLATTSDSKDIDISTLTSRVKIFSVEFPLAKDPASFQVFQVFLDILTMEDFGDGSNARIRWGKLHVLDAASSTIPPRHDEVIVLGATGYLAASASIGATDKTTTGGKTTVANYLSWGQERLARYEKQLTRISRSPRIKTSTLVFG